MQTNILLSALVLVTLVGCFGATPPSPPTPPRVTPLPAVTPPSWEPAGGRLVVVRRESPWLVALATPLAAQGEGWVLVRSEDEEESALFLRELARLAPGELVGLGGERLSQSASVTTQRVAVGRSPLEASLAVARWGWGRPKHVVVVQVDDGEGLVYGAALAAHLSVPLLLAPIDEEAELRSGMREIGVEEAWVLDPRGRTGWSGKLATRERRISADEAPGALNSLLTKPILVVVVARRGGPTSSPRALAATYSVQRNAAIFQYEPEPDDPDPEPQVRAFLKAKGLHPRSVLLLGAKAEVGARRIVIPPPPGPAKSKKEEGYTLLVEPFTRPARKRALSVGVGRIPYSLERSSQQLLRSFARKRLSRRAAPQALLIANPKGDLPLAELVARLTERELRNRRVETSALYNLPSDHLEAIRGARESQLIVYQGHIGDQRLFEEPPGLLYDTVSSDSEDEVEQIARVPPRETVDDTSLRPLLALDVLTRRLEGSPVLILQSCRSLQDDVLRRFHALGGVGVIGSVTKIHSASGAAFVHALIHGLLERGHTLGEALRDARNYFFLLQDLKRERNHAQASQSLRVAYSFRLWGDPELRLFPRRAAARRKRPGLTWDGSEALLLRFPKRRLAKLAVKPYAAKPFPGTEVAGIVSKKQPGRPLFLRPLHYRRLRVPEGWSRLGYQDLSPPPARSGLGTGQTRCVFRLDQRKRTLHVLYLPRAEQAGTAHRLTFSRGSK